MYNWKYTPISVVWNETNNQLCEAHFWCPSLWFCWNISKRGVKHYSTIITEDNDWFVQTELTSVLFNQLLTVPCLWQHSLWLDMRDWKFARLDHVEAVCDQLDQLKIWTLTWVIAQPHRGLTQSTSRTASSRCKDLFTSAGAAKYHQSLGQYSF